MVRIHNYQFLIRILETIQLRIQNTGVYGTVPYQILLVRHTVRVVDPDMLGSVTFSLWYLPYRILDDRKNQIVICKYYCITDPDPASKNKNK